MPQNRILYPHARLLVAEDNPLNQKAAMRLFSRYGCQVTPAIDGKEALALFKAQPFDLVFMDCQMPEMDGYEASRAIRAYETEVGSETIPIIAFTAHLAQPQEKLKFREAGMDDYLAKPVDQHELEKILSRWLPPQQFGRAGGAGGLRAHPQRNHPHHPR